MREAVVRALLHAAAGAAALLVPAAFPLPQLILLAAAFYAAYRDPGAAALYALVAVAGAAAAAYAVGEAHVVPSDFLLSTLSGAVGGLASFAVSLALPGHEPRAGGPR